MEYKEIIRKNFEEWTTQGFCDEAVRLNQNVGEEYFDTADPHFFTGDIHAEIVLVQLNPKRNEDAWHSKDFGKYRDFSDYWDFYSRFGARHYGENSPREHKSRFDSKQIRFLSPFGVLPFTGKDKYADLEIVVDRKLQLELVPFGSPNFDYRRIGIENLKPYIDRLIEVLAISPRQYIIFCGRVFQELLADRTIGEKTHSFALKKVDGSTTQRKYEVINIMLGHNGTQIKACIAPQFAQQGCPISKYGEEVSRLYGIF